MLWVFSTSHSFVTSIIFLNMPASEDILTIFIATEGAHKVSAITIRHWLLGLELWHTVNGAPGWVLCSVTLQAFADTLCAVSHGVLQLASCPCTSRSPQPCSPCMGIGSRGSCFFLVSLPISFPHSHLCYYVICPACMRSASYPHDYCTCMFSAFDAGSFCSALDFRCTYIRLEKHVCFTSSYIDFDPLSLSYSCST